jgi:DNA-directed DNA polymerase III PolC
LGLEFAVVLNCEENTKQPTNHMTMIAKNLNGVKTIYDLATASQTYFYYEPRIDYEKLLDYCNDDVIILSGSNPQVNFFKGNKNFYLEASPSSPAWLRKINEVSKKYNIPIVACSDNQYPRPQDKGSYEIVVGERNRYTRTTIQHIANEWELKACMPMIPQEAYDITHTIAEQIEDFDLPKATNVKYTSKETLEELCAKNADIKGVDLSNEVYSARLKRELELIKEKDFEDYFFVIADMVSNAKKEMLVGPARGSSAGSLVCYLLDITDVDPIVHDLMFERFVDVNRLDLPDIDIDFPDVKRDSVIERLKSEYGEDCVARIGTVSRLKPKSALTEVSKSLKIPLWEVEDLKKSIVERSSGDARASFCIRDTFETLDIGRDMIKKYPGLRAAEDIENHARHTGQHAAGVIVLNSPVKNYCPVNRDGVAQIEKEDAEFLNILKIDALGLRTLSILEDAVNEIGKQREYLINLKLDDKKAYKILNDQKFAGVFQFEGYALQSLCKQLHIESFLDIAYITTLARPGPLHSGGTTEFIKRRTGEEEVTYLHPKTEKWTKDSYGVIIFQEQVMQIARNVGKLSWEDTSNLRKAMSKSLGEEFFNQYWEMFREGAKEEGIEEKEARNIWEHMCTFGSWAFNKSHAISYAMISYWCAYMKAHHPLEFAVACLRNAKDDDQVIKLLRELVTEGIEYKPFDKDLSEYSWAVKDGKLIGGLIGIKGIGPKNAEDILERRKAGRPLTTRQSILLDNPEITYLDVFECHTKFGDYYENPKKFNIQTGKVVEIKTIQGNDEYIFIGKMKERNLRDLNEYGNLVKRGGRKIEGNNLFLNLTFEDDSDMIICTIDRFKYLRFGKLIIEQSKIGDWFLIKGEIRNNWRKIFISNIRKL